MTDVTQETIARVTGYFNGMCVVEPLDKTAVLPAGAALYANQQIDKRVKVKLGTQYGDALAGNWFYLQPADEFANAALYKHTGVKHD